MKQPKKRTIYRRSTLAPKKKDESKRFRNQIVNFRVSPEEKEILDERIRLSGLARQDYFLQSMFYQQIVTYGSVIVFTEMREQMDQILRRLEEMGEAGRIDENSLETLRTIAEIIKGVDLHEEDVVTEAKSEIEINEPVDTAQIRRHFRPIRNKKENNE